MTDTDTSGRRLFLKTTGGVVGLGLAGCVGDGAESGNTGSRSDGWTTAGGQTPGNEALRSELGLAYPDYDLEDELDVLHWTEYWHDTAVQDFEDAFDVSVSVTTAASLNTFIQNMTRSEFEAYDVVFPSDWLIRNLIDSGWLMPLDTAKLTNWENVASRWREQAPYDVGAQRYSTPYQWGTTGIGWNDQMVAGSLDDIDNLDSWAALWDDRFAGQTQMLGEVREVYAAPLKRMGESLNVTDPAVIEAATDMLVEQKETMRLRNDDYDSAGLADVLLDQEATPLHTWSGEAFIARYGAGDADVRYRIPREGGVVWIDAGVVPSGASSPNAAHALLDYTMAASVAAQITNFTFYASPNRAAEDDIFDEILTDPAIYPPEDVQENLEFIRAVGDAFQHYEAGWNRLMEA